MIKLSEDNNTFVCTVDRSTIKFNIFFPNNLFLILHLKNLIKNTLRQFISSAEFSIEKTHLFKSCMIVFIATLHHSKCWLQHVGLTGPGRHQGGQTVYCW